MTADPPQRPTRSTSPRPVLVGLALLATLTTACAGAAWTDGRQPADTAAGSSSTVGRAGQMNDAESSAAASPDEGTPPGDGHPSTGLDNDTARASNSAECEALSVEMERRWQSGEVDDSLWDAAEIEELSEEEIESTVFDPLDVDGSVLRPEDRSARPEGFGPTLEVSALDAHDLDGALGMCWDLGLLTEHDDSSSASEHEDDGE